MGPLIETTIQSATSHPRGTEYQIESVTRENVPEFAAQMRARLLALREDGVIDTVSPNLEDIPLGNIKRFTELDGVTTEQREGNKIARLYQVVVTE